MAGFIPPSTATSDTERLHRLQRRLDAWEVMLETPGQTSGNKDWQKRQKRLQELRHRLELLIMRREVPPFLKKQQEIQLPPLEICSEDEHKLCEQYLDAQLKISQHLTDQLVKVSEWVNQASNQVKNTWRSKLQLTKIRRYLSELDQERQRLDPHRTKQLQNWKKITDRFLLIRGLQNEANDPRLAFSKIVQLTDAVGTLQQSVHTLQGKTQRMNAWLKQANKRLLLHRPIASPLAEDLRRTAQKLDSLGLEDLHRSKSRLALARKYLEKYLSRAQFLASAQEDQ